MNLSAKSRKRAGSTQKKSSSVSNKSSGSSKRAASSRIKRMASGTSSSVSGIESNSPIEAVSTTTEINSPTPTMMDDFKDQLESLASAVNKNKSSIEKLETSVSAVKKYDDTDIRKLIRELSDKFEKITVRVDKLEKAKTTSTTTTQNTASSTTTTISSQNVPLSNTTTTTSNNELGYIKGTADLCKPDETGHKYCSVAINVDKNWNNGTFCYAWSFGDDKLWHIGHEVHTIYTVTGQHISAREFSEGKPSLFAMNDFSYYTDNERLKSDKYVLLCGLATGPSNNLGVEIFEDEVVPSRKSPNIVGQVRPFTHSDGSMVLFTYKDGKPLLRYNLKQNILEYKPNLSESYIKELRSYDKNEFVDVRGEKYKTLDW